jgi:hypothetical protein
MYLCSLLNDRSVEISGLRASAVALTTTQFSNVLAAFDCKGNANPTSRDVAIICLFIALSLSDPMQPVGDLLRPGTPRRREPTPRYRHRSVCLHACACSFLGRTFRAPTDGRTCDNRQHNAGYFVGLLAREGQEQQQQPSPNQASSPPTSSAIHSMAGARGAAKKEGRPFWDGLLN